MKSDRQSIMAQVHIRKAIYSDFPAITHLAMSAFGLSEGPEIVQLIADLSVDVTAQPVLSLVATVDESIVGHILFSNLRIKPPGQEVSAALLAPLAVHPDFQSRRIGSRLVTEGLCGVPKGIRTPVTAVKGRCPRPLDDGDNKIWEK
jgi:putative acetyltransferase